MPEKCLFCGEVAVIEESVDGGREQKICVECGSLAAHSKCIKSSDFFHDDDVDGGSHNTDDEPDTDTNTRQASLTAVCISCGVDLDCHNNTSTKSQRRLCLECSELDEDDDVGTTELTLLNGCASGDSIINCNSNGNTCNNNNSAMKFEKNISLESLASTGKSKCSSCGSNNLSYDSIGCDDRLICTDCGMVNSDTVLTADSNYIPDVGTTCVNYHSMTLPQFAERKRVQEGMKAGLTQISNLCSKFCFPSSIKSEAEDMYSKLFRHPKIIHMTIRKKEYVAVVCLFIICRQNDLPISLAHFKQDVACFSDFLRLKKFLVRALHISLPHLSMTRYLTDILDRLEFGMALTTKVKDILFLFRRAWLTQGRSRPGLIALAAYYAHISSNKSRKIISRNQFCDKNNLARVSCALSKECQNFLFKLACSLPWVKSQQVTLKNLHLYINSVLEYQESLFHLVFRDKEKLDDTIDIQELNSSPSSVLNPSESVKVTNKRRPLIPFSQKEILLPSASKRRKMNDSIVEEKYNPIPRNVNLDSPILQEDEFEEEIDSYILSSEEQERVRKDKMDLFIKSKRR